MSRRVELLFGDDRYGTEEFGWLPRSQDPDAGFAADDEDYRYRQHLASQGIEARIQFGTIIINDPRAGAKKGTSCP